MIGSYAAKARQQDSWEGNANFSQLLLSKFLSINKHLNSKKRSLFKKSPEFKNHDLNCAILSGKEPAANTSNARNAGLNPGWEDSLEEGMATHSSILAWRIPWTEKTGGLRPMGSKESDTTGVI